MALPGVTVAVSGGNLARNIAVSDSQCALIGTVATSTLIGVVKEVYSLADAESKGYTSSAESFIHRHIKEFYNEVGGNMKLFVMGVAETMSMADVLTSTNTNGLKKLMTATAGEVNLVGVVRKPASSYNAGTAFLDSDVSAAVTASKTLCAALQADNTPVRVLIEGRVATESATNAYSPNEATNGYAAVVLGSTSDDKGAAVGLALGRAAKYGAAVKIGSGQSGALSAQAIYVGTKKIEERLDMTTLHDAGFMTFMRRPGASGYYFGVDYMCAADDYKLLAHGRIVDKAQRIAAAAYLPYVEDTIRVDDDGTLNSGDTYHLESVLDQAIRNGMADQISGVKVVIDTDQDIVNTSTLVVGVSILPLGYMTWITVNLGLTNSL